MFEDDDPNACDDDPARDDQKVLAALSLMFLAVAIGAAWFYLAFTKGFAGPGH